MRKKSAGPASSRRGYHHGDARNALLTAAADLLEKVGAAGLSLRQVAEHAGLSRQAPYNHFENKEALLAELVRDGFEHLAESLAAGGDPKSRNALARAAEAYIRRAQKTPALFRLMFSRELVNLSRFPAAAQAGAAAFGKLREIVAALTPADRVGEVSLAAWSLVHGYATLCIEVALEPIGRRAERAQQFARIIRIAAQTARGGEP
ncbi:MAG TPA: TetR/AcrR family transcriptional regulator [Steroidobacteraceae bacterium]|nr:TetR/AcrR family transcriptional regulator [Steroidobacteraceae bacterium]